MSARGGPDSAAAGDGLLLTANGVRLVQLKTRRPVLLDTSGFDGLSRFADLKWA